MSGTTETVGEMAVGAEEHAEERLHPNVVLTRRGHVEVLRIDREDALGALNADIMEALHAYVSALPARSDEVRAVVLTGTGRSFVAGADIGGYHGASQTVFDGFQRLSRKTFDALAAVPQATVCAVNGYALGGGLELALCCDLIVVSAKAKLGLPEIKLGLLPGGGGTQRLTRLVGMMRAKEIALTGRMFTAEEAVRYGAAIEAVEPHALMERALALADTLASQAPLARAEIKRVIEDGLEASLPAALTLEQRALGGLFATADGKEGIASFIEKRDPAFTGS